MITVLFTGAAALIAAIVFVPFQLTLRGTFDGKFDGDVLIKWLWGIASAEYIKSRREISVLMGRRRLLHFKRMNSQRRSRGHSFGVLLPTFEGALSIICNMPALIGLVRKTCRSLSVSGRIRLIPGLGDPAETGFSAGLLAVGLAAVPIPLPISVEPDFAQERCVAKGTLSVRIVIWRLLLILAGWLFSHSGRAF